MKQQAEKSGIEVKKGFFLLLIGCALGICEAQDHGATMHLELPNVDGTSFVRLSDFMASAVVLNFWSADCPPCIEELPVLSSQSRLHPSVQFLGIATDEAARARHYVEQQKVVYPQLLAPTVSSGLMRRFGNKTGALPYTVVLNSRHQICQTKTGAVTSDWLAFAVDFCSSKAERLR